MDHSEVKHFPKVDHTPNDLDEASKILLEGAALIERDGWFQCNGRGTEHCAVLSLMRPTKYSSAAFTAIERLAASIGVRNHVADIFAWNDTPGRTKDQVVAKLRAVALGL